MQVQAIRDLYQYDAWVNGRLLDLAEQVPEDQTRIQLGGSFDSLHGTLAHILGAEIVWLSRWRGISPARTPGGADFTDLAAVRARWDEHDRELEVFLSELTEERLVAPLRYTNTSGEVWEYPLWQMLVHVVNHGTHHRSELADMLTRLGLTVPPTDLLVYFDRTAPTRVG